MFNLCYETRGSSVQKTLSMWDSVRRGEERWIFPFQENADVIFNSSTLYELAVLKRHIFPLRWALRPRGLTAWGPLGSGRRGRGAG